MSTPTPLPRALLTTAIRELLEAGTELQVGDGNPPDPLPDRLHTYYLLSELPGAFRDADAVDLYGGVSLQYQLTTVALLREQCATGADLARRTLTTDALNAALADLEEPLGLVVAACESDGPGGTEPRGDLFNTPETYTVAVFRSAS